MLACVEMVLAFTKFSDETVFNLPVWDFLTLLREAEKRAKKAEREANKNKS